MIFFWISGRLRSRNLYLRRISSLVFEFSSTGNGGVSASERILISSAMISISPVLRLGLIPPSLLLTLPVTAITNSERSFSAFVYPSAPTLLSSKISWRIPLLSLRSTKMIPPLFLLFCTHPMTVTFSPIIELSTSVHLLVLLRPNIDSAILISSLSIPILYRFPGSICNPGCIFMIIFCLRRIQ